MNGFVSNLVAAVLIVTIPIVAKAIIALLESKKTQINESVKDNHFRNTISQAITIVQKATDATSNLYVDALKKNGTFTLEAQREAMVQTVNRAYELMSPEIKTLLITTYSDIDAWIRTTAEAYIRESKI